jgi:hypothetical protein
MNSPLPTTHYQLLTINLPTINYPLLYHLQTP